MRGNFPNLAAGTPTDWLVYGVCAVVVVYMVLRPLAKKRKKDPLDELPRYGVSQQRAVERDMQHLLVELSDMARQVTGQLDTRTAKLDALIQEADEKIAELKRLQSQPPGAAPIMFEEPPNPGPPYSPSVDPARERPYTSTTEPQHREIYNLADAGRSPQDIAAQLDRPRGEVELILALRPR